MDYLQMKQGDLEQIWDKINENQFIFHPSLSPSGRIDIGAFLLQRFSSKPISIIIDNNLFIDLVKLCQRGSLTDKKRMRFIALFMLWVEINRLNVTAGVALQEKADNQDNFALSHDFSVFQALWEEYQPQQWYDLYMGLKDSLPILTASEESDMSEFMERPATYYQAYASMLHLVNLLRNKGLDGFERVKEFITWTYRNTIVSKYNIAYACLLFLNKEEGIKTPKKAYSKNLDAVLAGCRNQAWDLGNINSWNQLLDMNDKGMVPDLFCFATQDALLKRVIMCCVKSNDLYPFFEEVFNARELKEVLELIGELQRNRIIRNDIQEVPYLQELVLHEETLLRETLALE